MTYPWVRFGEYLIVLLLIKISIVELLMYPYNLSLKRGQQYLSAAQARILDEMESELSDYSDFLLRAAERPSGLKFYYTSKY